MTIKHQALNHPLVTTIKERNNSFSVENILKLNKTLSIKDNALIDKNAFIISTKR